MGEIFDRGPNTVLKICPICGKKFIPTVHWSYKKDSKFYCRYNCYRKAGGDSGVYRTNIKD